MWGLVWAGGVIKDLYPARQFSIWLYPPPSDSLTHPLVQVVLLPLLLGAGVVLEPGHHHLLLLDLLLHHLLWCVVWSLSLSGDGPT